MTLTKSFSALPGERVLAVQPAIAPNVDDRNWLRRTLPFPSRSLSHLVFETERRQSSGRVATTSQLIEPGVVQGLEARLSERDSQVRLGVTPGVGLTVMGEDVRLSRILELPLDELQVTVAPDVDAAGELDLATLRDRAGTAPLVIVLVLQPVETRQSGRDPRDPCLIDPDDRSFDDLQIVDGVRLCAFHLSDGLPTPDEGGTESEGTWRNRIAYRIFERERESGRPLEWEPTGVAVGLLAARDGQGTFFLDRASVARPGGTLHPREARFPGGGVPRSWQARVRQFTEHLTQVGLPPELDAHFRYLPPVGALPRGALDVRGDRGEPHLPLPSNNLFPSQFVVEAVPVELESLDDWLQSSAPLAPLDLQRGEQVQVLVPLPQHFFDPDVLLVEDETPDAFRIHVRTLMLRLSHRLGRRATVRSSQRELFQQLYADAPSFPVPDPEAVLGEPSQLFADDDELPAGDRVPPKERGYVDTQREELLQVGVRMARLASPFALAVLLERMVFESSEQPLGTAPPPDDHGVLPQITTRETAQRLLNRRWGGRGLTGFVQSASEKLVEAGEALTLSFARIEADLYRVRAIISGETVATKLATSPALASVAPRPSFRATPVELREFQRFLFDRSAGDPVPSEGSLRFIANSLEGAGSVSEAVLFSSDIRQRLRSSPATDAAGGAIRAKRAVFRRILAIHEAGISLNALRLPGFRVPPDREDGAATPWDAPPSTEQERGALRYRNVKIQWVRFLLAHFDETEEWLHDPAITDEGEAVGQDESTLFAQATRSLEHVIAALRVVEGQLAALERALSIAKNRLDQDLETQRQIEARLAELHREIIELRNDIRVARALEREEIRRATLVNRQRRELLERQVPFLVFRRPRTIDAASTAPTLTVEALRSPSPIPACVRGTFEAPPQLRAFVDRLRDLPLSWQRHGDYFLRYVNRREALRRLVAISLHRAENPDPPGFEPFEEDLFRGDVGETLARLYRRQSDLVRSLRAVRLRFAIGYYDAFSWRRLVPEAARVATINDVILASHGRHELSNWLARWLTRVYQVSACLFDKVRRISPFLRLRWAELLSQPSANPDLSQLSSLPSFEEVDRSERRDMQAIVDWLLSQVNPEEAGAQAFVNELLWFCFLLASHPRVSEAVTSALAQTRPVESGDTLELSLPESRVRVGMPVLLFESADTARSVGSGVIEDVDDQHATIRVTSTDSDRVILPIAARAAEADEAPLSEPETSDLELEPESELP